MANNKTGWLREKKMGEGLKNTIVLLCPLNIYYYVRNEIDHRKDPYLQRRTQF